MTCQHRDDGRGRCIDCGAFLPSADGDHWAAPGSRRIVESARLDTMVDLMNFLRLIEGVGDDPSGVYPNMGRVSLVEETLTDGSKVYNLHFSRGAR